LSVLQAFPLSVHSKSFSPLSYPFLKLDPRLCNPLLRFYAENTAANTFFAIKSKIGYPHPTTFQSVGGKCPPPMSPNFIDNILTWKMQKLNNLIIHWIKLTDISYKKYFCFVSKKTFGSWKNIDTP
jgi:hypothetical protein